MIADSPNIADFPNVADLPHDLQRHISSYYASPERTAAGVCNIRNAVCEFNRRRIKTMASLALNKRLLVRLQRLRDVTALRRQQNTHQCDAT